MLMALASVPLYAGNLWNGTFEDGSLSPWTTTSGSAAVGSTAHSGNYGLTLGPGTGLSAVSQVVSNLVPGQTYVLSAWLRGSVAGSTAELAVNGSSGLAGSQFTTTTSWQLVSQAYTAGSNGQVTVYLGQLANSVSNTVYWDDAALTPIPPANAGFEGGSLAPWTLSVGGQIQSSTVAHSGSYALQTLTTGTTVSQTVAGLVPGQPYVVAAWIEGSAASTNAAQLAVLGANPTVTKVANTTTSWQQISATYTPGAGGALTIALMQLASGISVDWDDITITPTGSAGSPIPSVLTYHNDLLRTGQNTQETTLTPANVNSTTFGKLFTLPTNGYLLAQPLYVPGQFVAGSGFHNVVVAATEEDGLYLFDADSNQGTNASPLWQIKLIDAAHGGSTGETSYPAGTCNFGPPNEGVTSTPVIDSNSGILYVEARSILNGTGIHRLHAIDLTTGNEKPGWPILVSGSVAGTGDGSSNGVQTFNPNVELSRAGLLLTGGRVYVTYGSNGCDAELGDIYHGWIFSYDAVSGTNSVFLTTPNGVGSPGAPAGGGIWMAGSAPAADAQGNIYLATGNGSFDTTLNTQGFPSQGNYGDSVLKIPPGGTIQVSDYFTPVDQLTLDDTDYDLGSGGVLLLPDQPGSYPHLLVEAGKDQAIRLINRDHLNEFCGACTTDETVEEIPNGIHSLLLATPAYWNNYVYYGSNLQPIEEFTLSGGLLSTSPTAVSTDEPPNHYGTTPSVSASGTTNGILWGVQSWDGPASSNSVLKAWNATSLANLYSSNNASGADNPGGYVEWNAPTVADGKVYVATQNGIAVYGLLPTARTPIVTEGDFDTGSLGTVWTTQFFNSGSGSITVTSASSLSGGYSLLEGASSNGEGAYQSIHGLTPGQSYEVSAWVSLNSGTTGAAYLTAADPSSSYSCASYQILPITVWQKIGCVYTAPADGSLTLGLVEAAGTLSSYWDDVSVVPVPAANPGFETGSLGTSWQTYFPVAGSGSITVTTSAAQTGEYGLLEGPSTGGDIAYQTETGLVNGQSYLVSANVQLASGTPEAAYVYADNTAGANQCISSAVGPTTVWQKAGCVYTVNGNQSMSIYLAQKPGSFSTNWDNVAVSPLPPLNGGFESGGFGQPWGASLQSGGYPTMTVSTAAAHSGSYGLVQAPTLVEESAYQAVYGLIPGQSYVMSAWVELGSGTAGTVFLYAADTQGVSSCSTTLITPTTTWQQIACTFTASDSTGVVLNLVRNYGNFTAYWDDAQITPVPPVNGGFESGAIAQPWQITIPAGGTGSFTVNAAAAHSGNYGLVSGTNSNGETLSQTVFGVPSGGVYTVTAWVKLGSGTAGTVEMNVDDGAGAAQCSTGSITPTSQWKKIGCTFTADSTSDIAVHLVENSGNFTTDWDDVFIGGPETSLVWENFAPSNIWVNF
jgi:hypothetical protein